MPETDAIPVSASVASTGKGIRYIGRKHAFGYSGNATVTDSVLSLLDFSTGTEYIVGQMQPFVGTANASDNYQFIIKFNGQIIATMVTTSDINNRDYISYLVIPPFTHIEITAANITDTSANLVSATITGRVYGAA